MDEEMNQGQYRQMLAYQQYVAQYQAQQAAIRKKYQDMIDSLNQSKPTNSGKPNLAPGAVQSVGSALGGATGASAAGSGGAAAGGSALGGTQAAPGAMAVEAAPAYIPAAVLAQTLLSGKTGYDMLKGKMPAWGNASITDKVGRVGLGIATGGLSEVGNKLFGHKSTKDYQKERWGALKDKGIETAGDITSAMAPEQKAAYDTKAASDVKNLGLVDHGANFNADLAAGKVKPEETWGALAHYQTLGNDYLKASSEDQRRRYNQLLIENKLINSNKGDLLYTDENKAKDLWKQVLAGGAANNSEKPTNNFGTPGNVDIRPATVDAAFNNPAAAQQSAQQNLTSSPTSWSGYADADAKGKEAMWAQHRKAMGVSW